MARMRSALAAAVLGIGIAAAASVAHAQWFSGPTVKATVRIPAKSLETAELRRIAVVPFSGSDGRGFADLLRAELQSATLDSAPYFTVINNEALSGTTGVGGASGNVIGALARLGSASGVDAVYYGTADGGLDQTATREQKKKCVEYEGLFNCKREQEYTANCFKWIATYSVTPQVVNVKTGTVSYSRQHSAKADYSYCDDVQAAKTKDGVLAEARAKVLQQLRRDVAPYNDVVSLSYRAKADDIKDKAVAAQFSNAAAFAKAGQVERACAMWRELAPNDETTSLALLFNLAVCAEVVGDYARAVQLFSTAEARLTKPDKAIFEARQRAQTALDRERAMN